jgi:hypothetical protein
MLSHPLLAALVCLAPTTLGQDPKQQAGAPEGVLAEAVRKTAGLDSYAFTINESPAAGTGGAVQGKYAKGQPIGFTADKIEFFKKGDVLAYKDAGQWQRSKTGTQSDPLRILGAAAKVRGARLPHEELPELVKGLQGVKKAEDQPGGATGYTGTLDKATAGKLAPSSLRGVAQGGEATVWLGKDGQVARYSLTVRVQGRLGNAEIDGRVTRIVLLSEHGTARLEIPEGAKTALEGATQQR